MTLIGGGLNVAGPANGMRFSHTRGRIQNGVAGGVNYPSPFFDIAHTYLPATVKQMFRWCRYYFLTNPLINATVFKLAEYPVTDIVFESDSRDTVKKWSDYFEDHLRYRSFQIEVGLDYFAYGNAFVSVGTPFVKWLSCSNCNWRAEAKKCRDHWVFSSYQFRLGCPVCGVTGDAKVQDVPVKNPSGVKLIRWNPEDIEVTYNDITGHYSYFYTIPAIVRNDIIIGRKEIVEDTPQIFIQALKDQKGLMFSAEKLFHLRRPTLATQDRGWGIPLLLPVLKDTYYLQLMKKAQETILLEHIVPLRIIFPQAGSGTSDPYTSINLVDWRDHVATEIARWRYDNNYIPLLPLPVGNQTIGGDGKALLMTQEMQAVNQVIMMGMGVPREFLEGGLSYAGTNVSMRMLENSFLGYVIRHKGLLRFVMQEVSDFLDWPMVRGRFKPFKMADDIQRKAFLAQLNQSNKVSDTTLLGDSDLSQEEENALMEKETESRIRATEKQQLAMAEVQGKVQAVMMKYQAKAQLDAQQAAASAQAPGEPGGPDAALQQGGGSPGGASAAAPADMPAGQVPTAEGAVGPQGDPAQQAAMMQPMQTPSEEFANVISSRLNGGQRMQSGVNIDINSMAIQHAKAIAAMDPMMQALALQNLRAQSPELADLVMQMLKNMGVSPNQGAQGASSTSVQVDTRPLPEQRGPRRATPSV